MRADRLISILLLLQIHGTLRARDLAARLEISVRTVYRDVEALSMAGVPVYARPGVEGGISLDAGYRFSPGTLSRPELQALLVASEGKALQDLGLVRASEDVLLKLLAALPDLVRQEARDEAWRVRQRVYVDPEGWFEDEEPIPFLPLVQSAVWEEALLSMTYQHNDGTLVERTVEAYSLVAKTNTWYLLARPLDGAPGTEGLRTYRVARIQAARLTGERFTRPADFHLAQYWQDHSRAFVRGIKQERVPFRVLVRVRPGVLPLLVKDLSGRYTREPEESPDREWVTLRIQFSSWYGALMRILSLGAEVEALEPESFREALRAELAATAERYPAVER